MTTEALFNRNIPFYLIFLLSALLWGGEYVRRDLWEPDEARFALVSKEMREGNHWLVPYRQGEFYSHKPPLMFWLINAFSIFTGGEIGSVTTRLPSFLGAMMALWAASRLAALWFSKRAGWLTVLILSSSFLFWNKGGFGQIDMLLCGLEMMALYFLFSSARHEGSGRILAAYLFMGLGILAKGPVGFIVPLGVYISASCNLFDRKNLRCWHWLWGTLVALSLPGLWLFLAWRQGAPNGYFDEILFKQNIGRIAGEFGGHLQPFHYYLKYLLIDFLPWTLLIPVSMVALNRTTEYKIGFRRLVAWIVFVVIFFSLSTSKRNLYILLVYPAAAMMVAAAAEHWAIAGYRWLSRSFWVICSFFCFFGATMTIASIVPNLPIKSIVLLPGGTILLTGVWMAYVAWKANPMSSRWLLSLAIAILITFASVGALVYPEINSMKTPDELIAVAKNELKKGDRIIMYRQNGEIFSLYTGHMGYMATTPEEVSQFIQSSPQEKHLIILLNERTAELIPIVGEQAVLNHFKMGSKNLIWILLTNPAKPPS